MLQCKYVYLSALFFFYLNQIEVGLQTLDHGKCGLSGIKKALFKIKRSFLEKQLILFSFIRITINMLLDAGS